MQSASTNRTAPTHRSYGVRSTRGGSRFDRHSNPAAVAGIIGALAEVGNTLEPNSPLDVDSNTVVLNLADLLLRKNSRSIATLRLTDAAFDAVSANHLNLVAVDRVLRERALEDQAVKIGLSDLALVIATEPQLEPRLRPLMNSASTVRVLFERRINALVNGGNTDESGVRATDAVTANAVNAQLDIWQSAMTSVQELVGVRLAMRVLERRVLILFAMLAVVLSAVVLTFVSRYEARRDRAELSSAKSEADALRAEVARIQAERALRVQEAQFRAIFENADLGIAVFDSDGRALQWNAATIHILSNATQHVLDEQQEIVMLFQAVAREPLTREVVRATATNAQQWLALTFSGVYDENRCELVVLLIRDITEERLLSRRLAYDARNMTP